MLSGKLWPLFLALIVGVLCVTPSQAEAGPMYALEADQPNLLVIDQYTGGVIDSIPVILSGDGVIGGHGLAVDPLDGSSGFGAGNAEWAVHVALSVDGEPSVGAVAVPGMGLTASTSDVPEVPDRGTRRPIVVTGRSRSWSEGRYLAEALDADLAACSSAGVKAMLIATGEADVYVHDAPSMSGTCALRLP